VLWLGLSERREASGGVALFAAREYLTSRVLERELLGCFAMSFLISALGAS
jgi:hypothetical protein